MRRNWTAMHNASPTAPHSRGISNLAVIVCCGSNATPIEVRRALRLR
jgi:hypothetical protein